MAVDFEPYDVPPDDTVLWRYMDLAGLLWLLSERKLLFTWPHNFEDQFEGQFSKVQIEEMQQWAGEHADQNRAFFAQMAEFPVSISCWHSHPHESAVMWKAYQGTVSTCIRTSVGRLRAVLPKAVIATKVKYIDYEVDTFDYNNAIHPYVHKRIVYEHEQEVRLIATPYDGQLGGVPVYDCGTGIAFDVDPQEFIDEIVIGPSVSPWFTETFDEIKTKLGYSIPVKASRVSDPPHLLFKRVQVTGLVPWDIADKVRVPRFIHFKPQPGAEGPP